MRDYEFHSYLKVVIEVLRRLIIIVGILLFTPVLIILFIFNYSIITISIFYGIILISFFIILSIIDMFLSIGVISVELINNNNSINKILNDKGFIKKGESYTYDFDNFIFIILFPDNINKNNFYCYTTSKMMKTYTIFDKYKLKYFKITKTKPYLLLKEILEKTNGYYNIYCGISNNHHMKCNL